MSRPPLPDEQIQVFTPQTNQRPYLSSAKTRLCHISRRGDARRRPGASWRRACAPSRHSGRQCGRSRFRVVVYVRVHISGRPTPDKHTEATRLFPPTPPFFWANEWHVIVWSGAFISVLLHVSARKVSFFDASRSSLIWQKCHPVVTSGEARSRSSHRSWDTSPVHTMQLVTRTQPPVPVRKTFFVLPAAPPCGKRTALRPTQAEPYQITKEQSPVKSIVFFYSIIF